MDPGPRPIPRALFAAALAVLAAAALAGVWCVDYLPTQDGPQHLFSIHAASRLDDSTLGYGAFLELAAPITSHGFGVLYAPLDRVLPWRTALRLTLSLMVLLWIGGSVLLARALHRERAWLGIALGGAAFQWTLYMGLFSFYVATAWGLLVLALALATPAWTRRRRVLLAGLLFVQALLHVVPAFTTGLALACVGLARAGRRGWPGEALRIAAMGLPAAAVAAALAQLASRDVADALQARSAEWSHSWPAWWTLGKCFTTGPAWRAWPLTLLALVAPGIALASRRGERPWNPDQWGLLCAGVVLLAAGIAAPLHLRAWDFFSVRFLPLGVVLLVVSLPMERLSSLRGRRWLQAALLLFALSASGWSVHYHRELAMRSADALSGLDAGISRKGPRLPIVLDPYAGGEPDPAAALVPYAVPLVNLGQLYAVAQGGVVPYAFAVSPRFHRVLYVDDLQRRFPPIPDPERRWGVGLARSDPKRSRDLRAAIATQAAGFGSGYEDVILWGRSEDADLLLHRGYVADWRQGGLLLAHFEGCPLSVRLPEAAALAPHLLELGWYPITEGAARYRVPTHAVDGRVTLNIQRAPCGAAWIRVRRIGAGVGAGAGAEAADELAGVRACPGADARGRLVIPSTRSTPQVTCHWSPARLASSQ